MFATLTQGPTWGITGTDFLWGYGALCVTALAAIGWLWLSMRGPRATDAHVPAEPDLYALAMLSGGSQLAITSAATQLHRDGHLRPGNATGTLAAVGTLEQPPDAIELAIFEAVSARPGITTEEMRAEVATSDAVRTMKAGLRGSGLLLESGVRARLSRTILAIGAFVTLVGTARVFAGLRGHHDVFYLALLTGAALWATVRMVRAVPATTRLGGEMLARWRRDHDDLRRTPVSGHSTMTAALFGGAALWLAAPEIASALGVEREWAHGAAPQTSGGGGGGDGGGCGGGCGGCGG
jgi:uncharacterized protein (TIGR04222 family)